jgi:hypothetical protein
VTFANPATAITATSPDEPIYQAIVDVLSNGRTSRLYRSLVRDKQRRDDAFHREPPVGSLVDPSISSS